MDLLALAQNRFQGFASALSRPLTPDVSSVAEEWLRGSVCLLVEQLCRSRRFCSLACWSIDHLARNSKSSQRSLVEHVDKRLVNAAKTTVEVANWLRIPGDPKRKPPKQKQVKTGIRTAKRVQMLDREPTIKWLSRRPWFDLVCTEEYFTGDRGLNLNEVREDYVEFWSRFDPEYRWATMSAAMFQRIDFFREKIDETWEQCFRKTQGSKLQFEMANRLFTAKTDLDVEVSKLREQCHNGRGQSPRRLYHPDSGLRGIRQQSQFGLAGVFEGLGHCLWSKHPTCSPSFVPHSRPRSNCPRSVGR
jgi:hypothetical protein